MSQVKKTSQEDKNDTCHSLNVGLKGAIYFRVLQTMGHGFYMIKGRVIDGP